MADAADVTGENEIRMIARLTESARRQGRELHPKGACHWCDEPFDPGSPKLFCDLHCSTDWERKKR